jgi:dephospho-CoA kinase
MKIILFTGLSGSGKSTIAKEIGKSLNLPVISLREVLHTLAVEKGFARTRDWVASVGIAKVLDEGKIELARRIGNSENTQVVLIDDVIDPETPRFLRENGNTTFVVRVKVNRHLRRRWIAHRLRVPPREAAKELKFLDAIKTKAGIGKVIQTADIEIRNFGRIKETINKALEKLEDRLCPRRHGAERE